MSRCENKTGRPVLLLAICFCLFSLAQISRPLESMALFSHPGVGATYHTLTRHTLKEVGGRAAELSAAATSESGTLILEGPTRISRLSSDDAALWSARAVVHRRIPPPPTSDDTH
jgi:hypothetical protein